MVIPPHLRAAGKQAADATVADATKHQESWAPNGAGAGQSKYGRPKQLPNSTMGGRPPRVAGGTRKKWTYPPLHLQNEPRPETEVTKPQEEIQLKSGDNVAPAPGIEGPAELLKSRCATVPTPPEQTPTKSSMMRSSGMEASVESINISSQKNSYTESDEDLLMSDEYYSMCEEGLVRTSGEKEAAKTSKGESTSSDPAQPITAKAIVNPGAAAANSSLSNSMRKIATAKAAVQQGQVEKSSSKRQEILAAAPAMILCYGRCGKTKPKGQFPLAQVKTFIDPLSSEIIRCAKCSMPETINGYREELKQQEDVEFEMVDLESESEDEDFDMCD